MTTVDGNASAVLYPAGHRPLAPEFSGTTLTGSKLSFSYYRGKVVVLNFWGSWCVPCREEASTLAAVASKYQPSGVSFLGVDVRDTTASAAGVRAQLPRRLSQRQRSEFRDHAGFHRQGADRRDADHAGDRPYRAHRGRGLRYRHVSGTDRDPGEGHREGGEPMTDVRAPETDPFDPAAEREDQPRPGPSSPGSAFGLADWLKWALAAAHLDADRADPALPAGPGQRARVDAAAAGQQPVRRPAVLRVASGPRALAEPLRALQRLRRALVRRHLPAAVRLPRRLRGAAHLPAGRLGADAAAAGPAPPGQAAQVRRVRHRAAARATRSRWRRGCCPATGSGSAGRTKPIPPRQATGSPRRRDTSGRRATCSSTWRCSACWCRSRSAGCSATRRTGCWCRARASPTP